jgi:hypothetical protein
MASTGSSSALLVLVACVWCSVSSVPGLLAVESSSAWPAELTAWRQLQQQRTGRLSSLLQVNKQIELETN